MKDFEPLPGAVKSRRAGMKVGVRHARSWIGKDQNPTLGINIMVEAAPTIHNRLNFRATGIFTQF